MSSGLTLQRKPPKISTRIDLGGRELVWVTQFARVFLTWELIYRYQCSSIKIKEKQFRWKYRIYLPGVPYKKFTSFFGADFGYINLPTLGILINRK